MKKLAGVLRTGFAACLLAATFTLGGCADSLVGAEPEPAPELQRPALPAPPIEATPLDVSERLVARFGMIGIPTLPTAPDSTADQENK